MRKNTKKGFTIVELVIVIAVIAVLTAVLIPTFSGIIHKANMSKDTQLVSHLNTALAADVYNDRTMSSAVKAANEYGFDLTKIDANVKGNEILWDSVANVFCYLNNGKIEYLSNVSEKGKGSELWIVDTDGNNQVHATYSSYVANVASGETITATHSIDVTACENVNVKYESAGTVDIFTNGGILTVTNESAEVAHYGESDEVIIGAVSNASYHEFGKAGFTQVNKGHYVMEVGGSTNALVISENVTTINNGGVIVAEYENKSAEEIEDIRVGATLFAGGTGEINTPYLIKTAEHIKNIGLNYDKAYAYYKVADGVESIDCSNWQRVNINGSFDGNGVVLNNVDSVLFNNAGTGAESNAIVIGNFTIKFKAGAGIVRVCATPNITFKNITATGYLIEDWNGAIFLRYGTNNFDGTGFNYQVNFVNCASTAEIYSTVNAYSSILIGHTYPGTGSATINIDLATDNAVNDTKLYYRGEASKKFGYKYFGAGTATLNVNGEIVKNNKVTGNNIIAVDSTKLPVKNNNTWSITPETDTTKIVAKVNWQYTLYTNNYAEQIADQSGVGGIIGKEIVIEVTNNQSIQILDKIQSVEIKTGSDKWDYEILNGKLTIYMLTDNQYVDGRLSLVVEQYTSGSSIAKYTGTSTIADKTKGADFIIK